MTFLKKNSKNCSGSAKGNIDTGLRIGLDIFIV